MRSVLAFDMGHSRLDTRLVALGLTQTRSKARDLILRGFVTVNGVPCVKPGQEFCCSSIVSLADDAPKFVSRGAEKLIAGLNHFGFDPSQSVALDIGASTGGFTQVLLERGAQRVYAVDVGHQQLHTSLLHDVRVVSLEKQDARLLDEKLVPDRIDAIVADVSFISLTKVLVAPLALTSPGSWLLALVKPQFEVGRDGVGGGGIVRDKARRDASVAYVANWICSMPGWRTLGTLPSPILGGSGNQEFLIGAQRDE